MNQQSQIPIQQEEQILSLLSDELRQQILIESNLPIVENSPVLTKFSIMTQQRACIFLELRTINQNETIFEEGDYSENPYYYYLQSGEIEFFVESVKGNQQTLSLQTLKSKNWFGELSFLTQQERLVGAVAKEKCEVYRLSRQDFQNIIKEQNRDYIKFCILEDKLRLNEINILRLKCWSCQSTEHTIKNCPFIHFVPDVEKIILKEKFSLPQKRKKDFIRYRDLKQKSTRLFKLVLQQQKKFKKKNRSLVLEAQKRMSNKKQKEPKREQMFSETNILNAESLRLQIVQLGNELNGKGVKQPTSTAQQDEITQDITTKVVDSFAELTSIDPAQQNYYFQSINSDFQSRRYIDLVEQLKLFSQKDKAQLDNSRQESKQQSAHTPSIKQTTTKALNSANQITLPLGQNMGYGHMEEDKNKQSSLAQFNPSPSPAKAKPGNQQNSFQFSDNSLGINGINLNINSLNQINSAGGTTPHTTYGMMGHSPHGFNQQLQQYQQTPQFSNTNPSTNLNTSNISLSVFNQGVGLKNYQNMPSISQQSSMAAPSPNHKSSISIIKPQGYNRGANKAAAIQTQQIFDIQNTNEEKLLDFNTMVMPQRNGNPDSEDGGYLKNGQDTQISPINESDPLEENDSHIYNSKRRQSKIINKKDGGFGIYSLFNKKNFMEEDQKYKQSNKQSIFNDRQTIN